MPGTNMATLDDLRRDIDRVDEVLVRLLNERARCIWTCIRRSLTRADS